MSFKKPFRAQPVKLGPYWRAEEKQQRRRAGIRLVRQGTVVAVCVFLIGMAVTNWKFVRQQVPTVYPSCSWARLSGSAPIQKGEPGYREALDADGDGIACEPLPPGRVR